MFDTMEGTNSNLNSQLMKLEINSKKNFSLIVLKKKLLGNSIAMEIIMLWLLNEQAQPLWICNDCKHINNKTLRIGTQLNLHPSSEQAKQTMW